MHPTVDRNPRGSFLRIPAAVAAALVILAQVPGSAAPRAAARAKATPVHGFFADFVPPTPFLIVLKQPDGTAVRARLNGAEIGGNLETPEGYALTKSADGWWYYAGRAEGAKLFPSKRRAGIDSPKSLPRGLGRTPDIWSGPLGQIREQTLRMLQIASYRAQMAAATTGNLPRVFKVPFLMLATWYDKDKGQTSPQFQAGHDRAAFENLLDGFGGNPTGTMTEFWLENSYGQLLVQVDVYGPYTSYRSLNDPCYYGNVEPEHQKVGNEEVDVPLIGPVPRVDDLDPVGNAIGLGGLGAYGMALEAVPQADADPALDFGEYDNDLDGLVDFAGIIHSGPDMAATGNPCHTWSHAIDLTEIPTSDRNSEGVPVRVLRLFTMPEINLDIGVAVHEMMHALGEPDYYNTSYTSAGTGDWDIMAGGSWYGNPPGSNPIGANPATKVFQGWVTPTVVHGDMRNVALKPREMKPRPGYTVEQVHPYLLLVPTRWTDSTKKEDVYGLPKDPQNGKYVTEGWYVEHLSRSVTGAADHKDLKRSPYFDRVALSSGVLIWHFDYWKKSNTYYGANNGQSDPNHPQMDPEEFDFNDDTQELQLNHNRGEPSDLWFGAATGMTSATRESPPGVPTKGDPQQAIEGAGVTPPGGAADYEFTVESRPGNYRLLASAVGTGDCTLALYHKKSDGKYTKMGSTDAGFIGDEEQLSVFKPPPGSWKIEVGDFAACGNHTWKVSFDLPFLTMGAADTWTNAEWKKDGAKMVKLPGVPTGWAITNIGPRDYHGWEHSADGGGPPVITLDILKLDRNEVDVSPGFVRTPETSGLGLEPVNLGRRTTLRVPVFNNGGKDAAGVTVTLKTADGDLVGSSTVASLKGYDRTEVTFSWTPAQEGPAELVATVDPANAIREAHEGNNVQKTRLLVGPANPRVLVVDDDGSFDAEDTYAGVLTSLGVPFAIADRHVDTATMRRYQAVIWEAGLDRYQGQLNADDRAAIKAYLDGGGRLWYTSTRAASALGNEPGRTNPGATPDMIPFLADYLGAKYRDTLQVGGGTVKGVGDSSGIGGKASFETDIFPGRPLQDQFDVAESKAGTAAEVLEWSKGGAQGTRVQGDAKHGSFRSVFFGFNLVQVVGAQDQVTLTRQVLTWLGLKLGGYTPATDLLYHTQVRTRISKQETPIVAYVFGESPVTVLFRAKGQGAWQQTAMKPAGPAGAYQATIPAAWSTLRGIEYFIRAGSASVLDPPGAPNLAHYVGIAPPEMQPPAVLGEKVTAKPDLPATGVGLGLSALVPLGLAGAALWLRRRPG